MTTTLPPADLRAWCDAEREYRTARQTGRFFGLTGFYVGATDLESCSAIIGHYARSSMPWRADVFAAAFAAQQDSMVPYALMEQHGPTWAALIHVIDPDPAPDLHATAMACWY